VFVLQVPKEVIRRLITAPPNRTLIDLNLSFGSAGDRSSASLSDGFPSEDIGSHLLIIPGTA